MTLGPDDRWAQTVYKHIDEADVFFLYWSHVASEPEWELKEIRYTKNRKGGDDNIPLEILSVILEKSPIPEPPNELKDVDFNDKVIYFID
jgi:hypothetical protein